MPFPFRIAVRHGLSLVPLFVTLSLAGPGVAAAGVRVLVAFDGSGQWVHSVSRAGAANANLSTHVEPAIDPAAVALAGEAVLAWLADDGRVIELARVPDPRVGHAPAPGGNSGAVSPGTPVSLAEGGWLAHGPDGAVTLVVRLPAVGSPSLPAEQWRLELGEGPAPGAR